MQITLFLLWALELECRETWSKRKAVIQVSRSIEITGRLGDIIR